MIFQEEGKEIFSDGQMDREREKKFGNLKFGFGIRREKLKGKGVKC